MEDPNDKPQAFWELLRKLQFITERNARRGSVETARPGKHRASARPPQLRKEINRRHAKAAKQSRKVNRGR